MKGKPSDEDLPRADQAPGAPHPRETPQLFGQSQAETDFLTAFNSDRLHHGWLLTGPQGIGKATLAWRIARFLLATPPAESGLFGAPPAGEHTGCQPRTPGVAPHSGAGRTRPCRHQPQL